MHQVQQNLAVPQQVLEWLVQVLQPIYRNSKRTFVDVVETLSQFNSFKPRTRVFTKENGSSELLLCLYGVLEGVGILIWVPKEYPATPPYVNIDFDALKGRRIKINQHLDSDGIFYLPIFSSWDPKHGSILKVVTNLLTINRALFPIEESSERQESSYRPKLPAHPPAPTVPTLPALPPKVLAQSDLTVGSTQSPLLPPKPPREGEGKELSRTTIEDNDMNFEALRISSREKQDSPTRCSKGSLLGNKQSPSFSAPDVSVIRQPNFVDEEVPLSAEDKSHANAVGRLQSIVNQLADSFITKHRGQWEQERKTVNDVTAQLRSVYGHEQNTLLQLQGALENNTKLLDEEIAKVQEQIEKARVFAAKCADAEFKISDFIVAETVALNQFYELVSKDHAITDTVQLLNRMLNNGTLSLDVFVKKTRYLAREQFLARAHIKKISELLE